MYFLPNTQKIKFLSITVVFLASLTPTPAKSQTVVMEVRVVSDTGEGVKSKIVEFTRARKELELDVTNDDGVFNQKFKCKKFHKIFAKPVAGPYTQSNKKACQKTIKLVVGTPEITTNLYAEAKKLNNSGDYATAALLFNEAYIRFKRENSMLADPARRLALVNVGKTLGVGQPLAFVAITGRYEASKDLVKVIKHYQTAFGVKTANKGMVDAFTLQHISGTKIWPYIAKAAK